MAGACACRAPPRAAPKPSLCPCRVMAGGSGIMPGLPPLRTDTQTCGAPPPARYPSPPAAGGYPPPPASCPHAGVCGRPPDLRGVVADCRRSSHLCGCMPPQRFPPTPAPPIPADDFLITFGCCCMVFFVAPWLLHIGMGERERDHKTLLNTTMCALIRNRVPPMMPSRYPQEYTKRAASCLQPAAHPHDFILTPTPRPMPFLSID